MFLSVTNASTVVGDYMNKVLCLYLDKFVEVFIDIIMIYSST